MSIPGPIPYRSYRLVITIILRGHPGSSGALFEFILLVDPREYGYAAQPTSVCLHTDIQRRDVPAAGLPSHIWRQLPSHMWAMNHFIEAGPTSQNTTTTVNKYIHALLFSVRTLPALGARTFFVACLCRHRRCGCSRVK